MSEHEQWRASDVAIPTTPRRTARRRLHGALMIVAAAIFSMAAASSSRAADYPNRPIRLIVPAGAGGNVDLVSRVLAQYLSNELGQPVVVEDKPGGSGNIGMAYVAHAPADGYTLAMTAAAMMTINPLLYKELSFDPQKDFTPVSNISTGGEVLVVRPQLGVKSVQELIDRAKANPGGLHAASAGVGSLTHLSLEMLKVRAGVDIVHVPYRSAAEALNGLLGGGVELMVNNISAVLPNIKAGNLIPLATTGTKRDPDLPDVPTFMEAGVKDYSAEAWMGIVGPAGLPASVTDRIYRAATKVLADPAVKQRLAGLANNPVGSSPDELREQIRVENARWAVVIKAAGLQAQ